MIEIKKKSKLVVRAGKLLSEDDGIIGIIPPKRSQSPGCNNYITMNTARGSHISDSRNLLGIDTVRESKFCVSPMYKQNEEGEQFHTTSDNHQMKGRFESIEKMLLPRPFNGANLKETRRIPNDINIDRNYNLSDKSRFNGDVSPFPSNLHKTLNGHIENFPRIIIGSENKFNQRSLNLKDNCTSSLMDDDCKKYMQLLTSPLGDDINAQEMSTISRYFSSSEEGIHFSDELNSAVVENIIPKNKNDLLHNAPASPRLGMMKLMEFLASHPLKVSLH